VTQRATQRTRWTTAWFALALALAGCAPLAPPGLPVLEGPDMASRFAVRLAERRERARVVEGDYSAWLHRTGVKDPPGVTVRTRLVAPDAFRLRVDALIGTAVEVRAHRDTLAVDAGSLGLSAVTDAAGDRSPRQDLGRWLWRVLAADWSPPEGVWSRGTQVDSAWVVRWTEEGDSLVLAVRSDGLPQSMTIRPPGNGDAVHVDYARWGSQGGVRWPERVVATDSEGRIRVRLDAQALALRSTDSGVSPAVRIPPGAQRFTRERLLALIAQFAGLAAADSATRGTP
jgi:hypothetical protein